MDTAFSAALARAYPSASPFVDILRYMRAGQAAKRAVAFAVKRIHIDFI